MFALIFGLLRATVRIAILTAIMVTGYALGLALFALTAKLAHVAALATVRAYRATKARLASRTAPAPETRAHVAPSVPRSAIPATDVRWAH